MMEEETVTSHLDDRWSCEERHFRTDALLADRIAESEDGVLLTRFLCIFELTRLDAEGPCRPFVIRLDGENSEDDDHRHFRSLWGQDGFTSRGYLVTADISANLRHMLWDFGRQLWPDLYEGLPEPRLS
jgi:hypothetical protein